MLIPDSMFTAWYKIWDRHVNFQPLDDVAVEKFVLFSPFFMGCLQCHRYSREWFRFIGKNGPNSPIYQICPQNQHHRVHHLATIRRVRCRLLEPFICRIGLFVPFIYSSAGPYC